MAVLIFSCDKKESQWSLEEQEAYDKEVIVNFLKQHTRIDGNIKKITNSDTNAVPFIKGAKLLETGVYYLVENVGAGSNPSDGDTILMTYKVIRPDLSFVSDTRDSGYKKKIILGSRDNIEGLNDAMSFFKGGIKESKQGRTVYNNVGKGILFIPATSINQQFRGKNGVLIYDLELDYVEKKKK
ncbi:FKBP-type peptidyl-prolyl cis-trans isomerase [Ichthyobacterium seriolicida]|uniref:Uncharacterized protein n=1 Tax=Ichthyobacterium seriolicida TaxID=242600 RepID=A0A1J1E6D0_9FLAO|nr:hypothetical protein [Ichthyobacterium seriolicida]BAV94878.1 hypothetical protein JBKA6_0865 [Ichthyobacterium seriolicida]